MFEKNILIVSEFWPKKDNPITGIFVAQQASALAKMGHKVTILLSRAIGRPSAPFMSAQELDLSIFNINIEVVFTVRIPEFVSTSIYALRVNSAIAGIIYSRKIKSLSQEYGNFDGCIVHGIRYSGLSVPKWADDFSSGIITVIHGVDPVLNKYANTESGRHLLSACSDASKVIVLVGRPLLKHASALGVPVEKQVVVSNGADIPDTLAESSEIKSKGTPVRLISVSNLIKLKGVDLNIRALSIISRRRPDLAFEYVVVGDGPEFSRLKEYSKSFCLDDRVKFLGRLPYQKTMEEVGKADIFSLPSWGEAFGIVYLEAMARHKPVIGCYENGAEDIFENGREGFLIKPHDVDALAEALEALIDDQRLRVHMGRKGRRTAEMYTWEANAKRMLEFLDAACRGSAM